MERHIAVTLEGRRFVVWGVGKAQRQELRAFEVTPGEDPATTYVTACRWAALIAATLGLTAQTIRVHDATAAEMGRQIVRLTGQLAAGPTPAALATQAHFASAAPEELAEIEADIAVIVQRTGIDADVVARVLACLSVWDPVEEEEIAP